MPDVIFLLQIDNLNVHLQGVHRLVQTVVEASQTLSALNDAKIADSSTQVQLLQKQTSDWSRLTHSLISAANETVVNPGKHHTYMILPSTDNRIEIQEHCVPV